jgi:formylglycine-generating enzyme required for sulfatase activity
MKWLKISLVILFAGAVTALGIDAADTLSGSGDTLLGRVIGTQNAICPSGMTHIKTGLSFTCVDTYEASPSEACPHPNTQSEVETQENANVSDCIPVSQEGKTPWRFVSLTQAGQFCARVEKRLPTTDEWFTIAQGQSDTSVCALSENGSPAQTGAKNCTTPSGVHDVVGNVWEWVQGEVVEGTYNGKKVPESGYISLVDSSGVVLETAPRSRSEFGNDYAWTSNEGVRGIIRGGFYGSGEDGGVFAQNMSVPLDFRTAGLGFRCVQ